MNLSTAELREIAAVLERLEEGRIATPRVGGAVGIFLRQFAGARSAAQGRLGIQPPGSEWISGDALVPIELVPITPLELRIRDAVTGSVTSVITASETLGTTLRVTLWGSARAASRLLRTWRRAPRAAVRLAGHYRWYPPGRITPGEARTETVGSELAWDEIRCLKYTGDDVGRAPHAAAFHPDWHAETPGVKAFRTLAIRRESGSWRVIPGLANAPASVEIIVPEQFVTPDVHQLLVLAWTQPWEPLRWCVIDARSATDDDVLAHNIAWADHIRELGGEGSLTGEEMRMLAMRAREAGLTSVSVESAASAAHLTRRLNPRALAIAGWLRGVT